MKELLDVSASSIVALLGRPLKSFGLGILSIWALVLITQGPANGSSVDPNWPMIWQETLQAAKREGQVTIYGSNSPALIIEAGVFQKAFPEIKVVTVMPGGGRIAGQRLLTERRAQKYFGDVIMGGSTTPSLIHKLGALDPIKPNLILPEVVDQTKWWQGKHRYVDAEQQYIFMYIGHPLRGTIFYNTKHVDPKEIASFWDFLNPKWKGKMISRDIRQPGTGSANMRFLYYNPRLGPEYIKRLYGEMNITLSRDNRQPVDWLATGKFNICFFCYPNEASKARAQGLPIEEFGLLKEGAGLSAHSGTIGLINQAPHPNAARVFINWMLSREGQLTMQTAFARAGSGASNSLRIDVSKDMVPQDDRLVEGIEYMDLESPKTADMQLIYKLFGEIQAEVRKREKLSR